MKELDLGLIRVRVLASMRGAPTSWLARILGHCQDHITLAKATTLTYGDLWKWRKVG